MGKKHALFLQSRSEPGTSELSGGTQNNISQKGIMRIWKMGPASEEFIGKTESKFPQE